MFATKDLQLLLLHYICLTLSARSNFLNPCLPCRWWATVRLKALAFSYFSHVVASVRTLIPHSKYYPYMVHIVGVCLSRFGSALYCNASSVGSKPSKSSPVFMEYFSRVSHLGHLSQI